jgi:hypothetical protein
VTDEVGDRLEAIASRAAAALLDGQSPAAALADVLILAEAARRARAIELGELELAARRGR